MTIDDERMAEIAEGEQWFREACMDLEAPDSVRIKQRVRIAINEHWLAPELGARPPADLADRTKRAVWAAAAAERTGAHAGPTAVAHPRSRSRWIRWAGGLGIAAAACLAAYLGVMESSLRTNGSTLSMLAAFDEFQPDELSESLDGLSDDLAELELAFDTVSGRDFQEESLDDLIDTLDDLISEDETGAMDRDWS
jgi:hypothetical protein